MILCLCTKNIDNPNSICYSYDLLYVCRVRFHYGHPDIFDRMFHLTRGGISKAAKSTNLSEDIFAGKLNFLFLDFFSCH
jgi:hypothetical protein